MAARKKPSLEKIVTIPLILLGVLLILMLYNFLAKKGVVPAPQNAKMWSAIEIAVAMVIPVALTAIATMVFPFLPVVTYVAVGVALIYVAVYFYQRYQQSNQAGIVVPVYSPQN